MDEGSTDYYENIDWIPVVYIGDDPVADPSSYFSYEGDASGSKDLYIELVTAEKTTMQWATATTETGVTDYATGKANTLALYKHSVVTTAANFCFTKNTNYSSIESVDDDNYVWFLPAQRQLMAMWISRPSFGDYTTASGYFWSSSETNRAAWSVVLDNGDTVALPQEGGYLVRCVKEVEP